MGSYKFHKDFLDSIELNKIISLIYDLTSADAQKIHSIPFTWVEELDWSSISVLPDNYIMVRKIHNISVDPDEQQCFVTRNSWKW